jgi:four helix bundle protein
VYQLAEDLGDQLWAIIEKWKPMAQRVVGEQLVRAADSIGANIAEGSGKEVSQISAGSFGCRGGRSTKRSTG